VKFQYVVYKLTFPNGKIYVGKDIGGRGHSMRYFGSWHNATVEDDFTKEQLSDFSLRKEILFESDSKDEVTKKESELILVHKSNDPSVGGDPFSRKRVGKAAVKRILIIL
jgi:hypothetical protein